MENVQNIDSMIACQRVEKILNNKRAQLESSDGITFIGQAWKVAYDNYTKDDEKSAEDVIDAINLMSDQAGYKFGDVRSVDSILKYTHNYV